MRRWQRSVKEFCQDEHGGNLVEYALLGSMVSIAAISWMIAIGQRMELYYVLADAL